MNGYNFQPLDTAGWVLPFCLLVMAVTLWVSWSNWRRRGGAGVAALETLRVLIMALILFTLCKPEFIRRTQEQDPPSVIILRDISGSMATRDVKLGPHDVVTRSEWLDDRMKTNFLEALEARKVNVSVVDFGMTRKEIDGETGIADGTDIADALKSAHANNLKAVFMLGDGDWNYGGSPITAARSLGGTNVPVYTLAVGSARAQKDLVLESVNPPTFGLLGEQISIPFRVRSHLPVPVMGTHVRLTSSRGAVVDIPKEINIPAYGLVHDSIVWAPRTLDDYTLTLSLPVWESKTSTDRELIEDNNRQTFHLSVREEKLNVLVVESNPRWEYRYLRNALSRDPGVEVSVLLLHPEMGPGEGRNYIGRFPDTREQLSRFDVIFLGDVGLKDAVNNELTSDHLDLIRGLVEQQGSGLVFLPGQRGRHLSLVDHPIGEMMPVTLSSDPKEKEGFYLSSESNFNLTSTGRGHFLTMLNSNESINESIWKNLPGFFWCAPVEKSRPGSSVLATHSSKRNEYGRLPVLVTRPFGAGEVLFMGTDAAWRWRRGVEDKFHYRFWGQVVRWMAHKRKMAQQGGLRLTFSPENPKVGDELFLQATLLDLSGADATQLRARITEPDNNSTSQLDFTAVKGGWGVFQAKMTVKQGGEYILNLENPNGSQSLQAKIFADKPTLERIGQPANANVLREIARSTGGESGGIDDLGRLISEISAIAENEEKIHIYELWNKPWWGGALLFLLAVYWVSRKILGLI